VQVCSLRTFCFARDTVSRFVYHQKLSRLLCKSKTTLFSTKTTQIVVKCVDQRQSKHTSHTPAYSMNSKRSAIDVLGSVSSCIQLSYNKSLLLLFFVFFVFLERSWNRMGIWKGKRKGLHSVRVRRQRLKRKKRVQHQLNTSTLSFVSKNETVRYESLTSNSLSICRTP